jgi:hypothetical protein
MRGKLCYVESKVFKSRNTGVFLLVDIEDGYEVLILQRDTDEQQSFSKR